MKEFITVKEKSVGEYDEKKSRFIAVLVPVSTPEEASEFIDLVKKNNVGARHNCYAFRLSEGIERSSDDGEPSGTGGKPLLELLQHNNLSDVLVVVTRYFGGVLLGVGGLKRAYTAAALEALSNAVKLKKQEAVRIRLEFDYSVYDKFIFILNSAEGEITEKEFSSEIKINAVIPKNYYPLFEEELQKAFPTGVKITEKEEILYFFVK